MDNFNQEMDRITAVLDRLQADVDGLKEDLDIPASVQTMSDLKSYRASQAVARLEEKIRLFEVEQSRYELPDNDDELVNYSSDVNALVAKHVVMLANGLDSVEEELEDLKEDIRVDEVLKELQIKIEMLGNIAVERELTQLGYLLSQ